jgi:hypothetical protein
MDKLGKHIDFVVRFVTKTCTASQRYLSKKYQNNFSSAITGSSLWKIPSDPKS